MEKDFLSVVKQATKNWWLSPIIGILAILLGIWCITSPWTTIIALSYVFAITFIITGLSEIILAVSNRNGTTGWGWSLASGIIDLLFGIILLALPTPVITLILSYFIGFWIMFHSIWGIGVACELQRINVKGWGWLLALAIMGVIMSFVFILSPVFTTGFIVALVSISFLFYGLFRIGLGFRFKALNKEIKELEKKD